MPAHRHQHQHYSRMVVAPVLLQLVLSSCRCVVVCSCLQGLGRSLAMACRKLLLLGPLCVADAINVRLGVVKNGARWPEVQFDIRCTICNHKQKVEVFRVFVRGRRKKEGCPHTAMYFTCWQRPCAVNTTRSSWQQTHFSVASISVLRQDPGPCC